MRGGVVIPPSLRSTIQPTSHPSLSTHPLSLSLHNLLDLGFQLETAAAISLLCFLIQNSLSLSHSLSLRRARVPTSACVDPLPLTWVHGDCYLHHIRNIAFGFLPECLFDWSRRCVDIHAVPPPAHFVIGCGPTIWVWCLAFSTSLLDP